MTVTIPERLADHEAGARDLAGWPRCTACGFRWPCPDLRNAMPEQTAHEAEVAALIDVGWSIWKARPGDRNSWSDADDTGGIVIGWRDTDEGRSYRYVDFPRGQTRFGHMAPGDVDIAACGLPNSALVRRTARRLCADVSKRKGVVTAYELELLGDAFTLMRTIA